MRNLLIVLLSLTTLLPLKTQAVAYLTSVDSLPLTVISQEGCAEKQKALRAQHCIQHPASNISQFEFDAANNLTSANNGSVSNSFVYDNMNRLVGSGVRWQESGVNFQTDYRSDLGGLVTNIVYPGNKTLQYAYDTDGRLTSVTDWNNHTFTFTHDAAGRRTSLAYPNGVIATNTYDAAHNLTSWRYSKSGSPIAGRTINRDAAGIKTDEAVTAGLFPNPPQQRRASNTFDAADRLTSAIVHSGTNTFNETYLYNANGSLTNLQSTVYSSQSTVLSHQAAYSYDIAGRFTGYNSQFSIINYQFNIAYDALGNRTRTSSGDVVRLWVTDHADPLKRPLMETDTSGNPVRYYIWGGSQLLAIIEADGTTHYAHSDEQGSIVALTDSAGTVTDQFSYGPYGENRGRTGTTEIPFRWLGSHGVFAATPNPSSSLTPSPCLYLTQYRAYDSSTTRFLSSDPLGLGGGPNLYSYCLGNPLSYIDPLGLCGEGVNWADIWNIYSKLDGVNPMGLSRQINTMIDMYNEYIFYGGGVEGYLYTVNVTLNPAVDASTYGYEAATGEGMQYYNSGQSLSGLERVESGVISAVNSASVVATYHHPLHAVSRLLAQYG